MTLLNPKYQKGRRIHAIDHSTPASGKNPLVAQDQDAGTGPSASGREFRHRRRSRERMRTQA